MSESWKAVVLVADVAAQFECDALMLPVRTDRINAVFSGGVDLVALVGEAIEFISLEPQVAEHVAPFLAALTVAAAEHELVRGSLTVAGAVVSSSLRALPGDPALRAVEGRVLWALGDGDAASEAWHESVRARRAAGECAPVLWLLAARGDFERGDCAAASALADDIASRTTDSALIHFANHVAAEASAKVRLATPRHR